MTRAKTALITGSTHGLGRQVALRLGASGFAVLVHGRDRERGARVVGEIHSGGGSAQFLEADFANLMLTRAYSGMRAYAQSRLAQIMFTFDLARELADTGVTVNCLHPASYVDTRMVRETGATPTSTVEEGTRAVMELTGLKSWV